MKVKQANLLNYIMYTNKWKNGQLKNFFKKLLIRDWSKSIGGGGPEHLEMWLVKNT